MSRRQIKKLILETLERESLREILQVLAGYPEHLVLNPLFIALCSCSEKVRHNAISCFGRIVPDMAKKDPEAARIVMRRFLWSLNDESGGIGWGVPEAMAEVMCHSKQLRDEYLHMLISYMREDGDEQFQDGNYIELPMLQRGLLWGIGRLCQMHRDEMTARKISDDIAAYLDSPDIKVAGLAIRCLGILGTAGKFDKVLSFLDNGQEVDIYTDDTMQRFQISQIALTALAQCQS